MSFAGKLKNAGFWQTFQVAIQVIGQFGYTAIMARLLSKDDFGLMAIAASFIAFGALFSEAGMGAALIQRKNISQKHRNAALQGSFISGIIVFLIFYFAAKPVSIFFNQPDLELIIQIVGVTIVLGSISSISVSLLQKHFRFKQTSLVLTISTLTGFGAGIFLGLRGYGVWSLVASTVITSVLNTIVLLSLAPVQISFRFHRKEWRELFSFGSGIILLKINNFLSNQGLNLILGRTFQPAQLGVFERASQIKNLPGGYLGNVLDTVMFPAMSEIQDNKEKLFRIYQHALGIVNTILIPVSIYLIYFSKEVVLILLGDKWLDAVLPLQIMLLILPFSTSSRMADSVIRARGFIYKNVKRKTLFVAVLFTSVFTGGYFFGIVGAACGVTFSYFFNYYIMLLLVKKMFNKKVAEIFFRPVISGIRLTVVVTLISAVCIAASSAWHDQPVLKFLAISFSVAAVMAITAYKKPVVLGVYLHELIIRMKSSRGKNSGVATAGAVRHDVRYAEMV